MNKVYNKLVRDLIPEIIRVDGCVPKVRKLTKKEYTNELFKKLLEEANEACEARGDYDELVKELGDVQEVIRAICDVYSIHQSEVSTIARARRNKRGAFKNRIFLESVEE